MIGNLINRVKIFLRTHVTHSVVFARRFRNWVWRARVFVVLALPLFISISVIIWWSEEHAVRYAGLFLQILGITEVVIGIRATRKLFDQPGLFEKFWNWLKAIPRYGKAQVISVAAVSSSASAGHARAVKSKPVGRNATIEQRIEALEANLKYAREDITQIHKRIDKETDEFKLTIKEERDLRNQEDKKIKDLLADAQTGGLDISLAGAIYLVLGVIMSTIPNEIACIFAR